MEIYVNSSQARLSTSISPRYIIVMVKKQNHAILPTMIITEAWKLINTQLHILQTSNKALITSPRRNSFHFVAEENLK